MSVHVTAHLERILIAGLLCACLTSIGCSITPSGSSPIGSPTHFVHPMYQQSLSELAVTLDTQILQLQHDMNQLGYDEFSIKEAVDLHTELGLDAESTSPIQYRFIHSKPISEYTEAGIEPAPRVFVATSVSANEYTCGSSDESNRAFATLKVWQFARTHDGRFLSNNYAAHQLGLSSQDTESVMNSAFGASQPPMRCMMIDNRPWWKK